MNACVTEVCKYEYFIHCLGEFDQIYSFAKDEEMIRLCGQRSKVKVLTEPNMVKEGEGDIRFFKIFTVLNVMTDV